MTILDESPPGARSATSLATAIKSAPRLPEEKIRPRDPDKELPSLVLRILLRLPTPRGRELLLKALTLRVTESPRLVTNLFDFRLNKMILIRGIYPYLLMLCRQPRDFDRSVVLYSNYFWQDVKKGLLRFPAVAAPECDVWPYRILGLLLAIRDKLSPFERIYLTYFPPNASDILKGREHFLLHEGSGIDLAVGVSSRRDLNLKSYILPDGHQNFRGAPNEKLNLPEIIPKKLKLLEWAFPELAQKKGEIATIKRRTKGKKLALLFSQPIHLGYHNYSLRRNREIYRAIVRTLFAHGYEVVLKPHPRETSSEVSRYRPGGSSGKLWVTGGLYPGEVLTTFFPGALLVTIHSTVVHSVSRSPGRKSIILGTKWLCKRLNLVEGAVKISFSVTGNLDKRLVRDLKNLSVKDPD